MFFQFYSFAHLSLSLLFFISSKIQELESDSCQIFWQEYIIGGLCTSIRRYILATCLVILLMAVDYHCLNLEFHQSFEKHYFYIFFLYQLQYFHREKRLPGNYLVICDIVDKMCLTSLFSFIFQFSIGKVNLDIS